MPEEKKVSKPAIFQGVPSTAVPITEDRTVSTQEREEKAPPKEGN
jgi:hypothetical protein